MINKGLMNQYESILDELLLLAPNAASGTRHRAAHVWHEFTSGEGMSNMKEQIDKYETILTELCNRADVENHNCPAPVFEDRDGVRMPVGYRPCDCVAEE